eukprot:Nitzschia sp. Nitz4//scaffold92_size79448//15354//16391//NITZ4_005386-RA/size79448-processed-gene-0.3-mRNA-1//1//CDS//3329560171//2816//frame0
MMLVSSNQQPFGYYQTLGVERSASSKEIQKAYRQLARKHHPDKGGNEEDFKQLSEAYDCLSDPDKRKFYDMQGGRQGGGNASPSFTGASNGGAHPFGGGPNPFFGGNAYQQQQHFTSNGFTSQTFFTTMDGRGVNLNDLFQGMFGGVPGSTGTGAGAYDPFSSGSASSGPSSFERPLACSLQDLALGTTKTVQVSYRGHRTTYRIQLQPGWKAGTRLTYPPRRRPSFPQMTFVIQEKPHAWLQRHGNNLHYTCRHIPVSIQLPTGDVYRIEKADVVGAGDKKKGRKRQRIVVPSKGMPIKGGPERGDLIVHVELAASQAT